MLKFLQRLVLDFPYICLYFFPGLSYRQMHRKYKKVVLGLLAHVMPRSRRCPLNRGFNVEGVRLLEVSLSKVSA